MNLFNDHLNLSNNIYDNAKILKSVELNKQQELVNRNPTTKYYQTLALNLQEQVQYLKRRLNEAEGTADPDVIYREEMTPEQQALYGTPSVMPRGELNPNGRGRFNTNVTGDELLAFMIRDILNRLARFAKGDPRNTLATTLSVLPLGRATNAAQIVALALQTPELHQLLGYLLGLQGGALDAFLNSLANGSISAEDLAKWNAAWNGAFNILDQMFLNRDGYQLNAGAPLDQEARGRDGNFDGHYQGTGGGNFYQPPTSWTTQRRPKP